jgi:hypothetical protein
MFSEPSVICDSTEECWIDTSETLGCSSILELCISTQQISQSIQTSYNKLHQTIPQLPVLHYFLTDSVATDIH